MILRAKFGISGKWPKGLHRAFGDIDVRISLYGWIEILNFEPSSNACFALEFYWWGKSVEGASGVISLLNLAKPERCNDLDWNTETISRHIFLPNRFLTFLFGKFSLWHFSLPHPGVATPKLKWIAATQLHFYIILSHFRLNIPLLACFNRNREMKRESNPQLYYAN